MVFGSIKPGPILEYPLIEHNLDRTLRPILINLRKIKGKRGWFVRRICPLTPACRNATKEFLAHQALQVGQYCYELHTDEANQKYLIAQRLTGDQIWMPNLAQCVVGYTDLTDEEIAITAMKVQSWQRNRNGGRYHVRRNNCQHFVHELWRRICTDGHGRHPDITDESLAVLGSVGPRFKIEWDDRLDIMEHQSTKAMMSMKLKGSPSLEALGIGVRVKECSASESSVESG
ncbi:hypothetical protein MBLNU230_g8539t1 [Neophaeotheca triangularis]